MSVELISVAPCCRSKSRPSMSVALISVALVVGLSSSRSPSAAKSPVPQSRVKLLPLSPNRPIRTQLFSQSPPTSRLPQSQTPPIAVKPLPQSPPTQQLRNVAPPVSATVERRRNSSVSQSSISSAAVSSASLVNGSASTAVSSASTAEKCCDRKVRRDSSQSSNGELWLDPGALPVCSASK